MVIHKLSTSLLLVLIAYPVSSLAGFGCWEFLEPETRFEPLTFPKSSVVERLPPTKFVFQEPKIPPDDFFVRSAGSLGKRFAHFYQKSLNVLTVTYFFSGTDSALGFQLFPNAKTVIAASRNPFLSEFELGTKKISYTHQESERYRQSINIARDGEIGQRIIGSLSAALPGFRLRSIDLIRTLSTDAVAVETSGIVHFDTGPGTRLRRYVHLNIEVIRERPEDSWWMPLVDQLPLQALIVKAAHFNYRIGRDDGTNLFYQYFRSKLERDHGILVQGYEPKQIPEFTLPQDRSNIVFSDYESGFGYTNRMQAIQY